MSEKHTPGPWEPIRGSNPDDDLRCAVVAKRGDTAYLVATIENGAPGDVCDTEWENARIMAAAPAMQEALTTINEMLTEEIAARNLAEGSELHSLLTLPRNIARRALEMTAPYRTFAATNFTIASEGCHKNG